VARNKLRQQLPQESAAICAGATEGGSRLRATPVFNFTLPVFASIPRQGCSSSSSYAGGIHLVKSFPEQDSYNFHGPLSVTLGTVPKDRPTARNTCFRQKQNVGYGSLAASFSDTSTTKRHRDHRKCRCRPLTKRLVYIPRNLCRYVPHGRDVQSLVPIFRGRFFDFASAEKKGAVSRERSFSARFP